MALAKNFDLVVRASTPQMPSGKERVRQMLEVCAADQTRHTGTGKTLAFLIPAIEAEGVGAARR